MAGDDVALGLRGSSSGDTSRQTSVTFGHRGANVQPTFTPIALGGSPASVGERRPGSVVGLASISPCVYGCSGCSNSLSAGACSTIATEVHHRDLVGDAPGGREVVGDDEQRDAEVVAQRLEQRQHPHRE